MPLLDHFHLPLKLSHPWTGVHGAWATAIAQQLNQDLPPDYYAVPLVSLGGQIEIDVATLEESSAENASAAPIATATWALPKPALAGPVDFVHFQQFEVQVLRDFGGPQLRAAIEIVSPANKDRPNARRVFAIKCANYLRQGISLIVIDIVTERRANLHAELVQILDLSSVFAWQSQTSLYALAYRPFLRAGEHILEIWPETLSVGAPMPELPLWLEADYCLPVQLEEAYVTACEGLRIRA